VIGGMIAAPIGGLILFVILLASLSESFAAWSAQYVSRLELAAALLFVLFLALILGPVIERAEAGLAFLNWLDRGMR
jgi:hypothetical protein